MALCKNQDLLFWQGVNLKILNLSLFVSPYYTFVYSNHLESYRIYANSPLWREPLGALLVLTKYDVYAIMRKQEYTNNGWRRILSSRKGVILMGNVASYVTWDQLIDSGIMLATLATLIYAIYRDHKRK